MIHRPRSSAATMALLAGLLVLTALSACRAPRGFERVYPMFAAPVHDLLADPERPGALFAACAWQALSPTQQVGGVLRSSDGGRVWVEANRGLPLGVEVLALAFAPPGFAADGRALLAGTRHHGIYVSSDDGVIWSPLAPTARDGPSWSRFAIQTIHTFPGHGGTRAEVLVGTRGHGVLASSDGGHIWEARNNGLLNLSIHALTTTPHGELLAATSRGLLRSTDRGHNWELLDVDLAQAEIAALALTPSGTLWIGLRSGELHAVRLSSTADGQDAADRSARDNAGERQAVEAFKAGVGILSLAAAGEQLAVGTEGGGVWIGRLSSPFQPIRSGLENAKISALWIDPDAPREIVLGTWRGLHRSTPPPPLAAVVGFAAVLGLGLVARGAVVWRRSVRAEAARLYHELADRAPGCVPRFLNRRLAELASARGAAVLRRLAGRLGRSEDRRAELTGIVSSTADLVRLLGDDPSQGAADRGVQRALADLLDTRVVELERLASDARARKRFPGLGAAAVATALQDRLFAGLLRAEGPAHLAALRSDLEDLARRAEGDHGRSLRTALIEDLRSVLDTLDQLGRLPGTEDRALFLSQALAQTLDAGDRAAARRAQEPSFGLVIGSVVLESLRHLLSTTLQDLRQRAELILELRTRRITAQREAVLVLELRNVGQGHAQNIVVEIEPQDDQLHILAGRRELRSLLRDQSARLELLIEPRVSERVRLRFRVTWDDLVRQGHRLELADIVELRQPESRRPFQPLRPNPYVVGRPLTEKDLFIGRGDLFTRLESSLRGAHQDNVVVLIGQRRIGKTSILRRLPGHLGERYAPALIDLQGIFVRGESAFFRELAATVHDELGERGVDVELPPPEAFQMDPASTFRRRFLRGVRATLGERRLLLVFDELEVLEERIRAGDLQPQILPYFRSLMQHETGVSFIFAGTHRLDELTGDYWGVLFNLAIYLEVGHLARGELERLFVEPTSSTFEIDPLALDKVYQITGGHPHFSQLLARELVELGNARRLAYITVQDIGAVARDVVEKGQLHIAYLWEEASRGERLLLLAVKELLEREGSTTLDRVHRYLSEHRVEPGNLPAAARLLARKEILSDNVGALTFRIDLLRMWIGRHHSLSSFILSESTGAVQRSEQ